MIAADLIPRGYKIAIPYGEDWDFDLIVCRDEKLERVQCKYTKSNGIYVTVRCRSHSLTNGKVKATKHYTAPACARCDCDCDRPATTSASWFGTRATTSRFDGASRIRTGGLRVANATLYQLSYGPSRFEW
jgi:PD-(D/E)XK endonuclease